MPEATALSEVLLGLTRGTHTEYDVGDVLAAVADYATAALGVRGAALSLSAPNSSVRHVTSNCDVLTALSATEDRNQHGPTLDALSTGTPVTLSTPDEIAPWPDYAAVATAAGVGAIAAVPARDPLPAVALTLGQNVPHNWTADEIRVAEMFAAMAGLLVLSGSELARLRRTADQLQNALDSRVIIEQAKGFIADARRVSVDEAFAILRKYANDHHATLRAVADAVVNLGLRP
jgi:GAF domain-containing protein